MFDVLAQALTNLSLDFISVLDDAGGRLVFVQPLRRCLGAHFRYPGDIVRGISNQRQVVNNLLRKYVKLVLYPSPNKHRVRHRIDQRHLVADQLCHVFVTRRDQYIHPGIHRSSTQGSDDVVRLNALDLQ